MSLSLIHDAARPNFSIKLLKIIIKKMKNSRAVIPIINIDDAVKERFDSSFLNILFVKTEKIYF